MNTIFEKGTRVKLIGDPNRTGTFVKHCIKRRIRYTTERVEVPYGIIDFDGYVDIHGTQMKTWVPIDQLIKIEEKK